MRKLVLIGAIIVALGALSGCWRDKPADYTKVNAVAGSLALPNATKCVNGKLGSFHNGATCQFVVSGDDAVASTESALTTAGFDNTGTLTYARGTGTDYVLAVLTSLKSGTSYTDVQGNDHTLDQNGALVAISTSL